MIMYPITMDMEINDQVLNMEIDTKVAILIAPRNILEIFSEVPKHFVPLCLKTYTRNTF